MSKKTIIILGSVAIVILIVLTAIVTCPDKDLSEEAVMQEVTMAVNKHLDKQMDENEIDSSNQMAQIGVSVLNSIICELIANRLQYQNCIVYSKCCIVTDGEVKTLSIGCFGHVFTSFSRDDIDKMIEKIK